MTRADVLAASKFASKTVAVLDSKAEGLPVNFIQLTENAPGPTNGVGVVFTFDDSDALTGIGLTIGVAGG